MDRKQKTWMKERLGKVVLRMESRGLKETSKQRISSAFRQFLEHTGDKENYDGEDVQSFLAKKNREGCKGTTVHNYYRYLKTVFDLMEWEWTLKPKDAPKRNTPHQPHYDLQEQMSLADASKAVVKIRGRYGELLRARNYAMIRLNEVTMLRRGEMRMLDVEDYRRPVIRVRNPEKNSEYTERILDPETCDALDNYLEMRKRAKSPALFIRGKGKKADRLSLRGLSWILRQIRKEAGIDKDRAGWHAFRRGGITIAHKQGMSPKAISEYTGITEDIVNRYIQLDKSEATEMFTKSHPFFKDDVKLKDKEKGSKD